MASQTQWKGSRRPSERATSPSPPSTSMVDWLPATDVSLAAARYYQRLGAQKKRRHDAVAGRRDNAQRGYGGYSGAMDALASTALASGNSVVSLHRHSASATGGERPSKRVRSDNYWATPSFNDVRRPTTSYEQSTASKLEDAQLLLDFVTSAARSTSISSATTATHYRSSSFGARPSYASVPTYPPSNPPLPHYQSAFDKSDPSQHAIVSGDNTTIATHNLHDLKEPDEDNTGRILETPIKVESPSSTGKVEDAGSSSNRREFSASGSELGSFNPKDWPVSTLEVVDAPNVADETSSTRVEDDTSTEQPDNARQTGLADPPLTSSNTQNQEAMVEKSDTDFTSIATDKAGLNGLRVSASLQNGVKSEENSERKKQYPEDVPQVCAACNFHRNSLTLETENESTSWISCDGCNKWFHFACAGFKTQREVRSVDKYRCKTCKPIHGPTTYVRKSARAHAPIDYAELNQGVVKTSEESPEHHYIKPIKEGTIKFTPETFARIRPELVTADFWLRGDGMREPVVIPTHWNPRPRTIPRPESAPEDATEDPADDGLLHDQSALDGDMADAFEFEQVRDEGQDLLDMVIPQGLTVRRVAELYGPEEKIEVIDVKSQNGEDKRWNMRKWADYYESSDPDKPVRNVISLEVSQSNLGRLIRRPRVVRDLDLQDSVWPVELTARGDFPKVQFYCLMSVADCYTDFHIDFGGSSVYYHILKGKKTFFFIPPTDANLKKYEDWCNSDAQNYTFLGDQTKVCYRVDLGPGDTMLIPAGWIHAVWTPEDSLVIGGNFLTRQNYAMQIRVTQVEKATKVPKKFRYPHFQKIMWYTMVRYLNEDPLPQSIMDTLLSGKTFERAKPIWDDYNTAEEVTEPEAGSDLYNARYYARCELEGLPELVRYLQRTAYIVAGYVTDGVSSDTKRAVQRSIPREHKQHGTEPIDCVRKFAMWCAWKRGNEYLPHWAYPEYVPEVNAPEVTQKKLSAAHLRRLEREATLTAQRVSDRPQREKKQPSNLYNEMMAEQEKAKALKVGSPSSSSAKQEVAVSEADPAEFGSPSIKKELQPKKRKSTGPSISRQPACEACRKGRRACKHRDALQEASPNQTQGQMFSTIAQETGFENDIKTEDFDPVMNLETEYSEQRPTTPNSRGGASSTTRGKAAGASPTKDSNTPGRAKACPECRKSKRRCIHDENGRQDPVKMAQASHPRPAAKKKRPSEGAADAQLKRPKKLLDSDAMDATDAMDVSPGLQAMEAPTATDVAGTAILQPATQQPTPVMPSETLSQVGSEAGLATSTNDSVVVVNQSEDTEMAAQDSASALVSPPESTHTDHERTVSPRPSNDDSEKRRELTPPTTASEPRSRRTSQQANGKQIAATLESPARMRSRALSTASVESGKNTTSRQAITSALNEADEDTIRLIHEMMAEDRGLRTRRESKPI